MSRLSEDLLLFFFAVFFLRFVSWANAFDFFPPIPQPYLAALCPSSFHYHYCYSFRPAILIHPSPSSPCGSILIHALIDVRFFNRPMLVVFACRCICFYRNGPRRLYLLLWFDNHLNATILLIAKRFVCFRGFIQTNTMGNDL